jgi:hypothetical protein
MIQDAEAGREYAVRSRRRGPVSVCDPRLSLGVEPTAVCWGGRARNWTMARTTSSARARPMMTLPVGWLQNTPAPGWPGRRGRCATPAGGHRPSRRPGRCATRPFGTALQPADGMRQALAGPDGGVRRVGQEGPGGHHQPQHQDGPQPGAQEPHDGVVQPRTGSAGAVTQLEEVWHSSGQPARPPGRRDSLRRYRMRMQSLAGAAVGHADEAAPVGSALAASSDAPRSAPGDPARSHHLFTSKS